MFISNAVHEIIQTNKNGEFAGHLQIKHKTLYCKNGDHLSRFDQSQNILEWGYWLLIGCIKRDKTTGCLAEPEVPFFHFLGASGTQGITLQKTELFFAS